MNPTSATTGASAIPVRLQRLELPERAPIAGQSARGADVALLAKAPPNYLDTTHFDTVRFPPPPWAAEAFARAAKDGSLAYTGYRGNPDVLKVLAESVGRFLGVPLDPVQNLILTPGTQAGLFGALASLVEEGDRVVLLDPDYLFSSRILRFFGADIGYVPLVFGADGPTPDLEVLETEFNRKKARYMVFSHPNNPTGAVFSPEVISNIARLANKYGITVLVDELYSRLLHDGRRFPHLAAQEGMFERTVTLLGPSKTESLSGYRLGVVVAPANITARIENVLSIMALRAPAYAQHVLVPWLRDDHDWLAGLLKQFTELRTLTVQKLRQLSWLKVEPQAGTAYVWPDVSALGEPGPIVAEALLVKAGVLVSPGYQFGPTAGGHVRVCYARDEQQWAGALDRMIEVLDKLSRRTQASGKVA
ncbi:MULTISPECIES: aminotransferase class I/II-fold pyridoxal phosphate-dependent enzyme [unclassified Bradyrhizobium]|uniref:aminotransferase class I/II-fold pyridoxal phosphate-dependent enzyme n=1 Tax=unclassified Bradyrhizobium TaxID=2631580 RepID=UPI0028E202D3|nr:MULTISPECIES: aminotransferase class I/II-fold pyridoxal phosphate-dependent enzyme [unclassified Bradyrhizobium]